MNKKIQSLRRRYFWKYECWFYKPCHIIMMWEFEENPIMIDEVGVKITNFSKKVYVQKGHNSGNSFARVLNFHTNVE
jgi:hypothetical protein